MKRHSTAQKFQTPQLRKQR